MSNIMQCSYPYGCTPTGSCERCPYLIGEEVNKLQNRFEHRREQRQVGFFARLLGLGRDETGEQIHNEKRARGMRGNDNLELDRYGRIITKDKEVL